MALKIRLARAGAKKRPYYLIVVAEARSPRDGRFLEKLGSYNPMLPKESNERVKLIEDRIKYWLSVGVQPTDRVVRFLGDKGLIPMVAKGHNPIKAQPKKKAQERIKEREEKLTSERAAREAAAAEAEAAARAVEEAKASALAEAQTQEIETATTENSSPEVSSTPETDQQAPEERKE